MPVLVQCRHPQRCQVQRHVQGSPADLACDRTGVSSGASSSVSTLVHSARTDLDVVPYAGLYLDSQRLGPSPLHSSRYLHAVTLEHESGRSIEVTLETASIDAPSVQEALDLLVGRRELADGLEAEDWMYVVDDGVDPDLIAADYALAGQADAQLDALLGDEREQILAQLAADRAAAKEAEKAAKRTPVWQGLSDQLRAAHPDVEIFLGSSGPFTVLNNIRVPEHLRGQGKAHAVMADLVVAADAAGTPLALTPSDAFGSSKKRLTEFYASYGFVANKGRNRDFTTQEAMIRQPS